MPRDATPWFACVLLVVAGCTARTRPAAPEPDSSQSTPSHSPSGYAQRARQISLSLDNPRDENLGIELLTVEPTALRSSPSTAPARQ